MESVAQRVVYRTDTGAQRLIVRAHATLFGWFHASNLKGVIDHPEVTQATHSRVPATTTADDALRYVFFDTLRRNINSYIERRTNIIPWISLLLGLALAGAMAPMLIANYGTNAPVIKQSVTSIMIDPTKSRIEKATSIVGVAKRGIKGLFGGGQK